MAKKKKRKEVCRKVQLNVPKYVLIKELTKNNVVIRKYNRLFNWEAEKALATAQHPGWAAWSRGNLGKTLQRK